MENIGTLMGKYGEEGDKLLFRIQNSGEKAASAPEKGLRYDLTVPFARYVVQHRETIQFPFKRYQIQPVWRADRPQKGRYREFYQCDVDVIGTNSLVCELELIQIVEEVYRRLGINVCLHINNRKVLAGIAEIIGQPEKIIDITVAIDKLDKIGIDNVNKELVEKGLPQEAIEALQPILHLSGTTADKLVALRTILASSEIGTQGVDELDQLFALIQGAEVKLNIELDLCLARGLNYYTGAIFEVKALDVQMGSITGGGRYDNLTGIFGMPNVSGVGISFGADRIYDVLTELNLYPASLQSSTQILFATFGQAELAYALNWAKTIRENHIAVEVYPEPTKMKKQMGYADTKQIPFVAIVGGDEMAQNKVMLKNMTSGEQKLVTLDQLLAEINS
jgi:histidyl-tRNA synthetase